MHHFLTKENLYNKVIALKQNLGIPKHEHCIDTIKICKQIPNLQIGYMSFNTIGLKGMSCIGNLKEKDVIILNSNQLPVEKNFICCHELMHLNLHREGPTRFFNCFDKVKPNQSKFLEWEANEGAAELLVPYELLLPLLEQNKEILNTSFGIRKTRRNFSSYFNVTETVIKYRFESLKYEINQYLNGTPLNEIEILSLNKQREKGINIKSLNDIENDLFWKEAPLKKKYALIS
mgnify:FL=1